MDGNSTTPTWLRDWDPELGERIETHLSVVYVGQLVYKLRKPVQLTFVDQSTVELRWEAAERELARGRTFSPHLYLGVWGVDDDGRLIEQASRSSEPVLVMKRAPTARCATRVLPTLDRPGVEAFAEELVALYQTLPRVGSEEVVPNVHHALSANFEALSRSDWLREPVAALRGPFDELLAKFTPAIEQRAAAGHARHCHGDLRLDHVFHTRPLSFIDPLDFDARLCRTDVLTDLAFLVLGLRSEGHQVVGEWLAEACLESWKQPEAVGLLSFFVAYRALVRTKVAWIRSLQVEAQLRTAARTEAEFSLQLVRQALDEAREHAAASERVTP